ncbi:hypothetical protein OZ411_15185 [Bradyrhizobium sp. Arg237L]|uniref:hypothetical protein n=1 Tax=Bradyrhizobium sp. Arg237L TaxID=3003352 RepID=UPI00249DDF32|nr:hypothetical protein [Bradyrhizobium sp. Arg237L]MDI4234156.1 hypothetical protein [Bradyrhizobium sp. Arg237L]
MADDDISISVKDALVLVPGAATALALCFEVGSFIPIGIAAFTYFSISEHITFAVPAIPIALVCVLLGVYLTTVFHFLEDGRLPESLARLFPDVGEDVTRDIFNKLMWTTAVVVVPLSAVLAIYSKLIFIFFLGLLSCAFLAVLLLRAPAKAFIGVVGLVSLAFALSMGMDSSRIYLNGAPAATVRTDNGSIQAVIVRSGERGVLLYYRSTLSFGFKKWDSIKSLDWPRQKLLEPD